MSDPIGALVGVILTLLVFSYLLGDTPLFRLAQALFVGVAAGYAATVAIYLVLWLKLFKPLSEDPNGKWIYFFPLALGILLFAKLRATWAPIGNLPIAFLFGVGGALAIGGALGGTLVPQLSATIVSLAPSQGLETLVNNAFLVIGTIGAFLSFRFIVPAKTSGLRAFDTVARGWGRVGRWFIFVAFGAIFAGIAVSRLAILIDRVSFLLMLGAR
ncbi:MAG: hypothetical protein HY868_15330 [Chloroflexi bacterium]|nr:hypothetical protein [Chloroflexota bacterium]